MIYLMLHNNVTLSGTQWESWWMHCDHSKGLLVFPATGQKSAAQPLSIRWEDIYKRPSHQTWLDKIRNYPPLVRQSDGWRNPWLSWPESNAPKTECKLHNPAICCDLWHCRAIGTWGWGRWQPRLPAGQAARISEEAWSFCTGSLTASHFGSGVIYLK